MTFSPWMAASESHHATGCAAMLVVAVLLAGWVEGAEPSPWGLDQRPKNPNCVAPNRPPTAVDVTSQQVFSNLSFAELSPISMSQLPGDSSRWFIAGRRGKIFSFVNDNEISAKLVALDITDRMQFTDTIGVTDSQQYGITSFVFHPQFSVNPYVYVAYNAKLGPNAPVHSIVSRFTSEDGGQTFESASEQILLSVAQADSPWHHLGQIVFGLDGYLYVGLGDGGPVDFAQNLNDLRGSILRVDVNQGVPYTIPPDNPLVGTGMREEIYAWGLRNPWRFSFDRETGELWAGDVGALEWEEINRVSRGGNYGWPELEGAQCRIEPDCDTHELVPPVLAIEHPTGRAIIGGYVYRGNQIPGLQGIYLFGDSVNSNINGLSYDSSGEPTSNIVAESLGAISAFAEDLDGEIYFFRYNSTGMYKLVSANSNSSDTSFPGLLSETGCVDPLNPLTPGAGLIPYTVNAPLWSDGAEKNRWIAMPDGKTIDIRPNGDFDFPIGTVLMKTFSFNLTPIETRLFVRHDDGGWSGYSYEWKDDLSDAVLLPAGKLKQISPETAWSYPSRSECLQCHTDAAGFALGPEISQLNGFFVYPASLVEANQLSTLEHIGLFTDGLPDRPSNLSALVAPLTNGVAIERMARSYLHSNCSGCHRPEGPVQSSADFRFSTPVEAMGVCNAAPNHGDLGNTDAKLLTPGDALNSLISMRIHSLNMNRMPPLGTSILDPDGSRVIDEWISQATVCTAFPDTDSDQVRDNVDNCKDVSNRSQLDTNRDGYGNACDADDDGVPDDADNCPNISNGPISFAADDLPQQDTDNDGLGNACDWDDDNDLTPDDQDAFPLDPAESLDLDDDGIGNNADPDDDNDGVEDTIDNCPFIANPSQQDLDSDSIGDACDNQNDTPVTEENQQQIEPKGSATSLFTLWLLAAYSISSRTKRRATAIAQS